MKNCQCVCDTLVACSCDKAGQPIVMKPETNCFDFSITHSILGCVVHIALYAAAIILLWILLKYITEWIKLHRERKIEETSQKEKFKRECQSKLLDFIKTENNSFDKISKDYENLKKEEVKEINKILDDHKRLIKLLYKFAKDDELDYLIGTLEKDIDSLIKRTIYDCKELSNSMNDLKSTLGNNDEAIKKRLYCTTINTYISEQPQEKPNKTDEE